LTDADGDTLSAILATQSIQGTVFPLETRRRKRV